MLILVLVAALAACGGSAPQADPAELAFESYSTIMQQMSFEEGESGAYDIDFVMDMEMEFMGESMQMVSRGNIQMIVDGEDIQSFMRMDMDMGELGSTVMEMLMVVEDGSFTDLRMTIDGEEFPTDIFPVEMFEDMFDGAVNVPDVEFEDFQYVEIEEVDDTFVMHITIDGQELAEFMLASMDEMLGEFDMEMDIQMEDVMMTIITDLDYNPLSMTMDMHMQMEFDEPELGNETMIMSMRSEFIFNGFGDSVELTTWV